jgi:eukaryotic-like serine/threonine-protein kinase
MVEDRGWYRNALDRRERLRLDQRYRLRSTAPAALHSPSRRVCPVCDELSDLRICVRDGTVTLSLDAPRSDPDRLQAGTIIADRYRIETLIGTGGFAKVFSALHIGTGQKVAVKVLGGSGFDDDLALRRFFREARASAGLKHPNTVRVFDFGQEEDGTVYLAMELLCGRTLRAEHERLRQEGGAFTEEDALRVGLAVVQSLAEAHHLGLVHRDIGPTNVFLHEIAGSDPSIKVLDFGLVKDGGTPLTQARQLFGTVAYMSPEQVLQRTVGPRSDLYSLGILLWWMVAGAQPFVGSNPQDVMRQHVTDPLPELSDACGARASAAFEEIIARATAKDPEDRYRDARTMRRALEEALEKVKNRGEEASTVHDDSAWWRRHRKWIALGVGVAVVCGALAGSKLSSQEATPPPKPEPAPSSILKQRI